MKCFCPKVLESEVNKETMTHSYCGGLVDYNEIIKEKKKKNDKRSI